MQKMPRRPAQPALPYKRRRLVVARSEEDLCEVSVRAALREEDAQTVRWRLKLLARARALGINTRFWPREDGDGADVEVGPFLLRRSGRAGQSVEQFCAEVDRAKQSLNALLWCFACLSAQEGQEPEEDLGVACRVRDYLEQQLGQATSVVQSPAACARAEVLRSALGNLAVIIEDSQPLSEAHRKVFTVFKYFDQYRRFRFKPVFATQRIPGFFQKRFQVGPQNVCIVLAHVNLKVLAFECGILSQCIEHLEKV